MSAVRSTELGDSYLIKAGLRNWTGRGTPYSENHGGKTQQLSCFRIMISILAHRQIVPPLTGSEYVQNISRSRAGVKTRATSALVMDQLEGLLMMTLADGS